MEERMSESQNNKDYGQQFKAELEQALGSGDFSGLNQLVNDTVKAAVSGAADQVIKGVQAGMNSDVTRSGMQDTVTNQRIRAREQERAQERERQRLEQQQKQQLEKERQQQMQRAGAWYKRTGNVTGTLFQVFGGIGTGLFAIPALVFLILFLVLQNGSLLSLMILFLVLFGGSLLMLGKGGSLKARLARAERYFQLSEKAGYKNISQLAEAVGRKESQVVKDLKALIATGVFPQGHLDQQQKCFMINDKTYEEYQKVSGERARLEAESSSKQQEKAAGIGSSNDANLTEQQKESLRVLKNLRISIKFRTEFCRLTVL